MQLQIHSKDEVHFSRIDPDSGGKKGKKKKLRAYGFDWKPEICALVPVVLPRGGLGTVPRLLKFKMMAGTVPQWFESEVDLSIG